jgi:hypothetical protein
MLILKISLNNGDWPQVQIRGIVQPRQTDQLF